MKVIKGLIVSAILSLGLASCASIAGSDAEQSAKPANAQTQAVNYRVRLFFGLSLPTGGGVSLKQWNDFQLNILAKTFDGFNVVDSTGFYKGEPERSKVVTIIVTEADMDKVRNVASQYATMFNQDSVMMVKVKVDEWAFIGKASQ